MKMLQKKELLFGNIVGIVALVLAFITSGILLWYVYSSALPSEYHLLQTNIRLSGVLPYLIYLSILIGYSVVKKRWFMFFGIVIVFFAAFFILNMAAVEFFCGGDCTGF